MTEALLSTALVGALLLFLAAGVWVAIALFATGVLGILMFSNAPVGSVLATTAWSKSSDWPLAALPLFIWMGEILFRSRLSGDLFTGLAPWMRSIPGRLAHVSIFGCGIFAAVSGSSAATCATVGKVAIPELMRRGYDERLVIGTIAGSGTLGLMIPPSIIMIVYGVATEVSIARLFVAGVVPGLMLIGLFVAYVMAWSLLNPGRVPAPDPALSLRARLWAARRLIPVVLLIAAVIGSIYAGIASPTDAAALGVAFALLLAWTSGDLTRRSFAEGLMSAVRTSCMIALILLGAAFLSVAMGYSGIPADLARWIGALELSPLGLIGILTLVFIVLGMFLDGISIVVLTVAVMQPMILAAGFDPVWFGIYLVLVVEMSQITPPVGFNLFVLQGLTGRDLAYVARAALPFFLILVLAALLLTLFPGVALWLPDRMFG